MFYHAGCIKPNTCIALMENQVIDLTLDNMQKSQKIITSKVAFMRGCLLTDLQLNRR